jgi:hypothetical protein
MATVMMKILKDYRSTDESCEGSVYFWLVSSEGAERMHFCDTIRPFLFSYPSAGLAGASSARSDFAASCNGA